MAPRRSIAAEFRFPTNPIYTNFPRTDGHEGRWPKNMREIVENGEVNYHRALDANEPGHQRWRTVIGQALQKHFGWPGMSLHLCSVPGC